jgi:hypothetical protein
VKNFPAFLWNLEVHFSLHRNLPLGPILSQIIHILPTSFFNFSVTRGILQSVSVSPMRFFFFISDFPTEIFYTFPVYGTWFAQLIILDCMILITLSKELQWGRSLFCNCKLALFLLKSIYSQNYCFQINLAFFRCVIFHGYT